MFNGGGYVSGKLSHKYAFEVPVWQWVASGLIKVSNIIHTVIKEVTDWKFEKKRQTFGLTNPWILSDRQKSCQTDTFTAIWKQARYFPLNFNNLQIKLNPCYTALVYFSFTGHPESLSSWSGLHRMSTSLSN
jgi:hypothetical protein